MEFKDYKDMNKEELKQLYKDLCEIDRNVTNDYKKKKTELAELQERKQELLSIKQRIEYLNSSNTMKANKSIAGAFTGLSIASLGGCIYLAQGFSNQPEQVFALAIGGLTLYCTSLADYAFLSSYFYDKRLLKENKLSELNPKINAIDKQIEDTYKNINTDEKILEKCHTNLPELKNRITNKKVLTKKPSNS